MRLRDFALGACLFSCQFWGTSLAQQAASAGTAAPAGATVYNVEIIVFRTTASLGSPENWAEETARAPPVAAASDGESGAATGTSAVAVDGAGGPAPGTRFMHALTADELQLGNLEARLKSSGSYVPVAHVGWAQTASAWGTHESMSLQQLGLDYPGLSGTVTLERGQFLHLGLAMQLAIANPPAGLNAPPQTSFVLNDNHRVKLYERNYFDAPAFGVIALVVPAQGTRRAGR